MEIQKIKAKAAPAVVAPIRPDPEDPCIVLTYADVEQLGSAMKKYIQDREGFIAAVTGLTTINVEGVSVTLEPRLLQRLRSRCLDKPNWPTWLAGVVTRQLHDYAGW